MTHEARGRRPRLDDVAAKAGVSSATVSLVLRGRPGPSAATAATVLDAAARLGYRPDRAASVLASRRNRTLGVLMDVRNPFHTDLVQDVYDGADEHGYQVVLTTLTRSTDETRAVDTLLDSRCAALILLGPRSPVEAIEDLNRQVPVVVVGRPLPGSGVDVVRSADEQGVAGAVDHLVGLGHRDITHVDGGTGAVSQLRATAYRAAMSRNGLEAHARVLDGGEDERSGHRVAGAVLADRPTAVLAFNDRCAVGLIDAVLRAGVDVPQGLSVIGYDDSAMADLARIGLTTVRQDTRQLTRLAVAALVDRLEHGRTEARDVVVPPRLIVRGTSGPPPAAPGPPT